MLWGLLNNVTGARVRLPSPIIIGANVGDYIEVLTIAESGNNTNDYRLFGARTDYLNLLLMTDTSVMMRFNSTTIRNFATNYNKPNVGDLFKIKLVRSATSTWEMFLNDESIGTVTEANNITIADLMGYGFQSQDSYRGIFFDVSIQLNGQLTHKYDPSATNGEGSLLFDTISGLDGELFNFGSEPWLLYESNDYGFSRLFRVGSNWAPSVQDFEALQDVPSSVWMAGDIEGAPVVFEVNGIVESTRVDMGNNLDSPPHVLFRAAEGNEFNGNLNDHCATMRFTQNSTLAVTSIGSSTDDMVMRLKGIRFEAAATTRPILRTNGFRTGQIFYVDDCILLPAPTNSSTNAGLHGVQASTGTTSSPNTIYCNNTIVYGVGGNGFDGDDGPEQLIATNCVAVDTNTSDSSSRHRFRSVTATNCFAYRIGSRGDDFTSNCIISNVASSDDTGTVGFRNIGTDVFVDYDNQDFRIKSDSLLGQNNIGAFFDTSDPVDPPDGDTYYITGGVLFSVKPTGNTIPSIRFLSGNTDIDIDTTGSIITARWITGASPFSVSPFGSVSKFSKIEGDSNIKISTISDIIIGYAVNGNSNIDINTNGNISLSVNIGYSSNINISTNGSISQNSYISGNSNIDINTYGNISLSYGITGSLPINIGVQGELYRQTNLDGDVSLSIGVQGELYRQTNLDGLSHVVLSSFGEIFSEFSIGGTVPVEVNSVGQIYRNSIIDGYSSLKFDTNGSLSKNISLDGELPMSMTTVGSSFVNFFVVGESPITFDATGELFKNIGLSGQSNSTIDTVGKVNIRGNVFGELPITLLTFGELDADLTIGLTGASKIKFGGGGSVSVSFALDGESNTAISAYGNAFVSKSVRGTTSFELSTNGSMHKYSSINQASSINLSVNGQIYRQVDPNGGSKFRFDVDGSVSVFANISNESRFRIDTFGDIFILDAPAVVYLGGMLPITVESSGTPSVMAAVDGNTKIGIDANGMTMIRREVTGNTSFKIDSFGELSKRLVVTGSSNMKLSAFGDVYIEFGFATVTVGGVSPITFTTSGSIGVHAYIGEPVLFLVSSDGVLNTYIGVDGESVFTINVFGGIGIRNLTNNYIRFPLMNVVKTIKMSGYNVIKTHQLPTNIKSRFIL